MMILFVALLLDLLMTDFDKVYEVFIDGFSGALGGVAGQLLLYPLENFRTRLQADQSS